MRGDVVHLRVLNIIDLTVDGSIFASLDRNGLIFFRSRSSILTALLLPSTPTF